MFFEREFYENMGRISEREMPFYMTYPMQNLFWEESEYEKDCLRMQQLYPKEARRIQELAGRACDRMDYEGSLMYDEFPDRISVQMIVSRIYREYTQKEELTAEDRDSLLMQMIQVILMQEMYRRRCRHSRCRRWY